MQQNAMPKNENKDRVWTESKFWSFIRSALRRCWLRFPPRYKALEKVRRHYKGQGKRQKYEYQCAMCQGWFKAKEVQIDHVIPCGSLKSYKDLPGFVERLFCDNLQILCKPDHQTKTNLERKDNKK